MIYSESEKQQLRELLRLVQKLEESVSQTLNRSVERRHCKGEIEFKQRRDQLFPAGYFSDPAWDILLDLYAAHLKQQPVSTTALGLVAGVPQTTMLRYLDLIVRDGFARKIADSRDGRRVFVELTPLGIEKMAYLLSDEAAGNNLKAIASLTNEMANLMPNAVLPVHQHP